jgi:precorrin-6A synthase
MRRVLIIGIGAGNPDFITVQAIKAMRQVDVFFITDKGAEKADLVRLRADICTHYLSDRSYRTIQIPDPERDRAPLSYHASVADWHEQRRARYEQLILNELGEEECGAFLIWGDPSLYDSILRIVSQISARGVVAFDYEVIPGITSVQALTARHRIPLNQIGEPVEITTGRQLSALRSISRADTVVMLDGECSFSAIDDPALDIYWGAYLGTEDEVLLSGRLSEVSQEIRQVRADARKRKGWIMDVYLLRKPARQED